MGKARDWGKDVEGTEITLVKKEGNYLFCEMYGFQFKVYRTSWPPLRLSPDSCLTPTEFYKFQVSQVHGDRYNLDSVVYTGADSLVTATCHEHGDFQITAKYLKMGQGCVECSYISSARKNTGNTEDFIEKAKLIHGDRYDYSLVDYKNSRIDIKIVCDTHGEFYQSPGNHLSSKGCQECGMDASKLSKVLSIDQVLERFYEAHGAKFDYTELEYFGDAHQHLKIICKEHGLFMQSYANHYHGKRGCPECAKQFSSRLRRGFIRSSGSKDGYASLYLINCFDEYENFYKIGITTKPVKHRFSGKEAMPYYYTVEFLLIGEAEWLWDLEKLLHREYKLHKYLPEKEFGGRYECFSHIDLDEYTKLLHTVA